MAKENKNAETAPNANDATLIASAINVVYGAGSECVPIVQIPSDLMSPEAAMACLLCDYYTAHAVNMPNVIHKSRTDPPNSLICIKITNNILVTTDPLIAKTLSAEAVGILPQHQVIISNPTKTVGDTAFAVFWMLPWLLQKQFSLKYPVFASDEVTNFQKCISKAKTLQNKMDLGMAFLKEHHYFDEMLEREKQARIARYKDVAKMVVTDNREENLKALESLRGAKRRELARLNEEIQTTMMQLRDVEREIQGWYARMDNTEDERVYELADFLDRMSDNIEITENSGGECAFWVHTYLDDIDQAALTMCCQQPGTPWGQFYATGIGEWFVNDILRSNEWKIRVRDSWKLSPKGVSLSNGAVDIDTSTETSNFHISTYKCIGGYAGTLAQYNADNDMIGALYTTVKATKGFNVTDRAVSERWIEAVRCRVARNDTSCRCLYNTKTGEIQSYAERYCEWVTEQRGETNERVDIGF